jgi:hypothetical protein
MSCALLGDAADRIWQSAQIGSHVVRGCDELGSLVIE